jgi:alkylhydroperoxidase family enzyme
VSTPRAQELDEAAAALLAKLPQGANGPLNLMAVLIHNPHAIRAWGRFTGAMLLDGNLTARERELIVLRTAWNARSSYEWGNHVDLARAGGVSDDEIVRLARPELDDEWAAADRRLLAAADELHADGEITEATFGQLAAHRSMADIIEVIFVVGIYHVVRSLVASLGVADEPEKPALGALKPSS